jgi:murein L,D-transpeptidase YafK
MKTTLIFFILFMAFSLASAQETPVGTAEYNGFSEEDSIAADVPADLSVSDTDEPLIIAPESDTSGIPDKTSEGHADLPVAAAAFEPPEGALIANVYSSGSERHLVVLVTKLAKKLYILDVEGDTQKRIADVDIISGRIAGAKRIEGDKRTPDGVYYTTSFLPSERLHNLYGQYADIYGFGAFPTNYPNPSDKALGYTGYGIWLHGLNPYGHKDTTEGCVAMENTDYEKVREYLSVGQTVILADQLLWEDEAAFLTKRQAAFDRLNAFFDAWRNGKYDVYKEFIHPKYKSYAAASADKYLAGKKALMQLYPKKTIELNNIKIYSVDDNTTVYDLDQFYCASNTSSYAGKRYYFARDGEEQRLISEEIVNKDVGDYIDAVIKKFVDEWAAAWESKDIDAYSGFYSAAVNTKRWRDYKEGVFSSTAAIDIEISGLYWSKAGKNRYRIGFSQNYRSDTLSDKGRKTLIIKGCPGDFTIETENWERSR